MPHQKTTAASHHSLEVPGDSGHESDIVAALMKCNHLSDRREEEIVTKQLRLSPPPLRPTDADADVGLDGPWTMDHAWPWPTEGWAKNV